MRTNGENEDEYLRLARGYRIDLPGARAFWSPNFDRKPEDTRRPLQSRDGSGRTGPKLVRAELVLEKLGCPEAPPEGVAVRRGARTLYRTEQETPRRQLKELAQYLDGLPEDWLVEIDRELSYAALRHLAVGLMKDAGGLVPRDAPGGDAIDLLLGGPAPGQIGLHKLYSAGDLLRNAARGVRLPGPANGRGKGRSLYIEVARVAEDALPGMIEAAAGKAGIEVSYW